MAGMQVAKSRPRPAQGPVQRQTNDGYGEGGYGLTPYGGSTSSGGGGTSTSNLGLIAGLAALAWFVFQG